MAKPCSAWTRSLASIRFRDHHPPHRIGPVRLRDQILAQTRQPCLQALRLDLSEAHPVHPWSTRISAGKPVGVAQDVLATDLVVEHVEAEGRLRLRLAIELPLKAPDLFRCYQAHRQSPSPRHLRKRTRSQGPLLRRHYPASKLLRPCPTPAMAVACRDVGPLPSPMTGLPRLPEPPFRHAGGVLRTMALPTTPADRAGARVDCFPAHSGLPQNGRRVGIRIVTFEMLWGERRGCGTIVAEKDGADGASRCLSLAT